MTDHDGDTRAILKAVGAIIERLRIAAGLRTIELALKARIGYPEMCKMENGERIAVNHLLDVCHALDQQPSDVLRMAEDEAIPQIGDVFTVAFTRDPDNA